MPYLSYVEASELLREERTKVVHYKVLDPLMKGKIELQIKNYYDEESEGTIIGTVEEAIYTDNEPRPKAISYQRGLSRSQVPTQPEHNTQQRSMARSSASYRRKQ